MEGVETSTATPSASAVSLPSSSGQQEPATFSGVIPPGTYVQLQESLIPRPPTPPTASASASSSNLQPLTQTRVAPDSVEARGTFILGSKLSNSD